MNETLKYRILAFIRYLGDSFFYPFFALYLRERGLVESKIGFILSISPLIGIITNPIYAFICKNFKITKKLLSIITILEAFLILMISFSSNYYLISILTLIMAIFGACHYGLMDSLFSVYSSTHKIDYSSIRLWGSFAYILGTTMGGFISKALSYQLCFSVSSTMFILSGFLYCFIKPIDYQNQEVKTSFREITKNKRFMIFLILNVLLLGTLNAGDYFFSVYLESRNIMSNEYGMIYSYYVIIEVCLLYIFSKYANKINNNLLIVIAGICLTIRLLINGMYAPLWLVVIASGLRGISYAIILHTSFKTVTKIVGEMYATKGIMLMTLCASIFLFTFNNIDGIIIEKTGTYAYFYLMLAGISLIGIMFSIFNIIINKKNRLNS